MLTAFIQRGDGSISRETSEQALAAALRDEDATFWLDMNQPTDEEIGLLDDVFGFHPLAIEDTINYMQRPKIESYQHTGDGCKSGYFYMVFHGPDLETFKENLQTKELDLFVSERFLVTIHEKEMRAIATVRTRAEADPKYVLDRGMDVLLYHILDHLIDAYDPILDWLQEALDVLEERALGKPEPEVLQQIASKKRELLNLRRIVAPQREVIAQITRGDVPFIRQETRVFFRDVQDHLIRVVELVELYRDLVLGARDIYLSSISNQLNQIMKTLTIITVICLPITLVTSFFGMNFSHVRWWDETVQSPAGFWGAMVFVGVTIVVLLYWFKRKKWL